MPAAAAEMEAPLLSIIIPTRNRPRLLQGAVESALAQTMKDFEIVVVDDASQQPVALRAHARLRVVRLEKHSGGAAARNVGVRHARGRWITFLDDDDRLLPHMAEVSLKALAQEATLPQPVAVLSGQAWVDSEGRTLQTHRPPTLPRGAHFSLEEIAPDESFFCKQTLVVERSVLLQIGGFDEAFASRIHTELFLRLNPVCSILGLPVVTYRQLRHGGPRVSGDPSLRQASFRQLVRKHEALFRAHPKMFADFVFRHAVTSRALGQWRPALLSLCWAMRLHPRHAFARLASLLGSALRRHTPDLRWRSKT